MLPAKTCAVAIIIAFGLSIDAPSLHAQLAAAGGALTVGALVDQIRSTASSVIQQALQAGDYLTVEVTSKGLDALNQWEVSNKDLIDTATRNLQQTEIDSLQRAASLTYQTNQNLKERTAQIQQITDAFNNIAANVPGFREAYVTRFDPHVVRPQDFLNPDASMQFFVSGVNLDINKAPVLTTPRGKNVQGFVSTATTVEFDIPIKSLIYDEKRLSINKLTMTYDEPSKSFAGRLFGRTHTVTRTFSLAALPHIAASYTFTGTKLVASHTSAKSKRGVANIGGRDTMIPYAMNPDPGYQFDTEAGVSGGCNSAHGQAYGPNNGIVVAPEIVKVNHYYGHIDRSFKYPNGGADNGSCDVTAQEFKIEDLAFPSPDKPIAGLVTWTDDISLPIDARQANISIRFVNFDGTTAIANSTKAYPYYSVDQNSPARTVTISPVVPADFHQ